VDGALGRQPGLIHVYCGDGKGKTTAAVGLILRAAGHGRRILLIQFLKNGQSGELAPLRRLPSVRILTGRPTTHFTNVMDDLEKASTLDLHCRQLHEAIEAARNGQIDLLVLDEAMGAIQTGLLPEGEILEFLSSKPEGLEVVLTGRNPSAQILELADYISEIRCVRHPWQRGITAREGIEY
jgi:cob(I)alamin adenosyltransferase